MHIETEEIKKTFKAKFKYFLIPLAIVYLTIAALEKPVVKEVDTNTKISEHGNYMGFYEVNEFGFDYYSRYLPMKDSVLLAADIFLPKYLPIDKKLPTLLYLTRYVRSFEPVGALKFTPYPLFGQVKKEEIAYFTKHGYACIIVDVRGTGASTGIRTMEFSPEEVKDGATVVDWIIAQPWSNGKVGSTGVSYLGTTAEMLLVNQHPAVKACIPRSSIFDLYQDIVMPGGVPQGQFIEIWKNVTKALDNNNLQYVVKNKSKAVKGPSPVMEDPGRYILRKAFSKRSLNFDIFKSLGNFVYRDEKEKTLLKSIDEFSVHNYKKQIEASGTPIYRISGWYDGSLSNSAIKGYLSTSNSKKLMIGPWDHGPQENVSPFKANNDLDFDVFAEMLRFFDYYLKGIENGIMDEKPIKYYAMGKEEWRSTDQFPPLEETTLEDLFLQENHVLAQSKGVDRKDSSRYIIDYTATTGFGTRYNSLTPLYRDGYEIGYSYFDRREESNKLLNFNTKPFKTDREITGYPVVELYVSTDKTDGTIFIYLEDVAPDGRVTYITEGMLRFLHRKESKEKPPYPMFGPYLSYKVKDSSLMKPESVEKVSFELLPVSYLIQKGHSLRISIAGTDKDHFFLVDEKPTYFDVYHNEKFASNIKVPFKDFGNMNNLQP